MAAPPLRRAASSKLVGLKPSIATVATHTMGQSLYQYLAIKTHDDIRDRTWSKIRVIGKHSRSPPARLSSTEKSNKPFNWQRPSTVEAANDCLELHCFPGDDYVGHYAAITATYLHLMKKDGSRVEYGIPSQAERLMPLLHSNLAQMGKTDIVIVGYVHGLTDFVSGSWEGGDSDQIFGWQKRRLPDGSSVGFLGCRVSFWGDIAGNVVRALQKLNSAQCILYIGKLGSLRAEQEPNRWLATGSTSSVKGEEINWPNVLEPFALKSELVKQGVHYSLPSVLDETKDWLSSTIRKFDFVDPEIGHMAKASLEGGTMFGYLHIISDNVARKYLYDLSNERARRVLYDRSVLVQEIQKVLKDFLAHWASGRP